jgi:hypothetical protein
MTEKERERKRRMSKSKVLDRTCSTNSLSRAILRFIFIIFYAFRQRRDRDRATDSNMMRALMQHSALHHILSDALPYITRFLMHYTTPHQIPSDALRHTTMHHTLFILTLSHTF